MATRGEVEEKVRQMFPPESHTLVMEFLDLYGVEGHERERERVQLAVLKLSGGDLDELLSNLEAAKQDYRDVLAYAEHPNQMRYSAQELRTMGADAAGAIRSEDRKQYADWLLGRGPEGGRGD